MPVLTVLKNIENWPFYSQSRKTGHTFFLGHPLVGASAGLGIASDVVR